MKKVTLFPVRKSAESLPSAAKITRYVRTHHRSALDAVGTIMAHPRSLARPTASWRPPSHTLPAIFGRDALSITVTRHRVGPRVQARMRGFGEQRTPAYLVTARLSMPSGYVVPPELAAGWVASIFGPENGECVHEFDSPTAPTFVWVVDGSFQPLRSPASLFTGLSQAA